MFGLMEQVSTFASDIDDLVHFVTAVTLFWFFLAQFAIFYFIFKYRKKKSQRSSYIENESASPVHKVNVGVDYFIIGFDIIILVLAMMIWYDVKQDFPEPDETVRVTGHQWAWVYQHPGLDKILDTEDDIRIVDELHIKKDTIYHFKLNSYDVLHSFSIPVFRLKQDAVPGREITGWFEATNTGEYDIQCAEMCGIGHGPMSSKLYIYSEEDYKEWLEKSSKMPLGSPTYASLVK